MIILPAGGSQGILLGNVTATRTTWFENAGSFNGIMGPLAHAAYRLAANDFLIGAHYGSFHLLAKHLLCMLMELAARKAEESSMPAVVKLYMFIYSLLAAWQPPS